MAAASAPRARHTPYPRGRRCPVILDDARNPRGILSAKIKGGVSDLTWFIAGVDCKALANAFHTDGVPEEGQADEWHRPGMRKATADSPSPGPSPSEAAGLVVQPSDCVTVLTASFTSPAPTATTPTGALAAVPLRLRVDGECVAFGSINGTPVCRYHGDLGPQHSFYLPDGARGGPERGEPGEIKGGASA